MLNKVFKLPVVGKVLKRTVSGKRWLFKVTRLLNATRPITAKIPKTNPPFTITYHAPLVEAVAVDLGGEILPGCTTVQLLSAFLDEHLPPTLESDDAPGAAPAPAARSTVQARMVSKLLEKGITTDTKATDDCASGDDEMSIADMLGLGMCGKNRLVADPHKLSSAPTLPSRAAPEAKRTAVLPARAAPSKRQKKTAQPGRIGPVASERALGQKPGGGSTQVRLNALTFTNAVLARHKALFESYADVLRLQTETGSLKGRVVCVVWTDDALKPPYLADCRVGQARLVVPNSRLTPPLSPHTHTLHFCHLPYRSRATKRAPK